MNDKQCEIGSLLCKWTISVASKLIPAIPPQDNAEKTAHLVKLSEGQPGKLELFSGDLSIPGSYDDAFNGADAVVHTAAVVEVRCIHARVSLAIEMLSRISLGIL